VGEAVDGAVGGCRGEGEGGGKGEVAWIRCVG